MRLMSKSVLIITLLICLTTNIKSNACTIFTCGDGEIILVGNNEEWMYSINNSMIITAPDEKNYGRVCFYNDSFVQGGMNEKGLFYDGATCPSTKVPYSEEKPTLGMDLGEVVLTTCANVQEVVEMLEGHNIPQYFQDHLLFTDQSGASIVIEWINGEMIVIEKNANYQLVTNFWLSNPELGGYPCDRYNAAKTFLEEDNELTVAYFTDILSATKQDWGDGGTLYSNVYNLTENEVYIYYRGDFTSAYKVNLSDELSQLKKGEQLKRNLSELDYGNTTSSLGVADTRLYDQNVFKEYDWLVYFIILALSLVIILIIVNKLAKKDKQTEK